jgi:3,4-dihydroxy 2-butanone 4-phosphate synthase/GTP cyclohydrolase II
LRRLAEEIGYFAIVHVRLLSNNPAKVAAVARADGRVTERVPCLVSAVDTTELYLRTKKEKMGHLLEGFD